MNVKLKVLTAGVLFFAGQVISAQEVKTDSLQQNNVKEGKIGEVLILGYNSKATKAKSTASSTTITASSLENRPNASFLNSVQGMAPGLSINSGSGSPGSGKIKANIRGTGSLTASTDPLFVIDGIISTGNEFRNLNDNDIETISVLRDAQATAIYGNLGANGVMIITTKSGKFNSGLKFSYDVTTNFSVNPSHRYDIMTGAENLLIQKLSGKGPGVSMSQSEIDNALNTDWEREYFRVGYGQRHNLGISYGGRNFSSYTSLGYMEDNGVIKNTNFKRFNFRNNISGRSDDRRLTYSAQVGLGYSKRNQLDAETNSQIDANSIQNPLLGILSGPNYLAPSPYSNGRELFNAIGRQFSGKNNWVLTEIMNGGIVNQYTQTSISVNGNISYELLKGLRIGNKTGVSYKHDVRDFARTPEGYLSLVVASGARTEYGGWERIWHNIDTTINSVTSINYDAKFGDNHTLTLGAYLDYLRAFSSYQSQTQNGLDPLTWALGAGTGYVPFNSADPTKYNPVIVAEKLTGGTLAYIGTLDYDFASKYGISATIRRDGSYRFAPGRKWDTFWSVAGRWNIDKEAFMDGSIFNMLKLRASYGINGNQNIIAGANNTNNLLFTPNLVRDTFEGGRGYDDAPGYYVSSLKNVELTWERVAQFSGGVDFRLWNSRLEGTLEYYDKRTTGLYNRIPISGVNGQFTIAGNDGELQNAGIEANLRVNILKETPLKLSVYGNVAYNKNKILNIASENLAESNVNAIGGSAAQWHLYRYVGVNKENGEYLFLDKNGNITETPTQNDRVLTGKSVFPKFTGGFGLDADYKGFYLSAMFSFQAGAWNMDYADDWMNRVNYVQNERNGSRELLNAWTPTNTNTDVASLTARNRNLVDGESDKYLRRTDFIKLKNVSIGYSLSKELLEGTPIKALKVYAMGENLATFTNWKGFDPEPLVVGLLGVYPNPRTYSIGLNVEF